MLDSRDLQKRLAELEAQAEAASYDEGDLLDDDEQAEFEELQDLASEVTEWADGATLIPEDDFTGYARELAEDTGMIPSDVSWPLTCIDWDSAADALKEDYSEVTYQGTTYLVRD